MAALRRVHARVHLVAPVTPGRVLVGPGPAEASRLTALDGPEVAAWLGGESADTPPGAELRADAVLAVTRSRELLARLGTVAPRVLERDPTPPPGPHASLWYAAPVRALGADPRPAPPALAFTAAEEKRAGALAARLPPGFLALHPGSGSPAKNWPAERFASLVRAALDGPWLLVSGPADVEATAALAALPGAVTASGLPLRVLGALLARAGLVVGNDSGVTHLAAAAGAPTLALFGPTPARTWAPVGPLVETLASPDGTMEGLDVSSVRDAVARLLSRARDGRTPGPP